MIAGRFVVVIVMVVVIHVCATYSGLGSWYYHEEARLDAASLLVFFAYESFSQAFFMGILFFVAATFTGMDGKFVSVPDTVRGFKEIIEGKHDDLPEQAFQLVGTIDNAREKAEKLAKGV